MINPAFEDLPESLKRQIICSKGWREGEERAKYDYIYNMGRSVLRVKSAWTGASVAQIAPGGVGIPLSQVTNPTADSQWSGSEMLFFILYPERLGDKKAAKAFWEVHGESIPETNPERSWYLEYFLNGINVSRQPETGDADPEWWADPEDADVGSLEFGPFYHTKPTRGFVGETDQTVDEVHAQILRAHLEKAEMGWLACKRRGDVDPVVVIWAIPEEWNSSKPFVIQFGEREKMVEIWSTVHGILDHPDKPMQALSESPPRGNPMTVLIYSSGGFTVVSRSVFFKTRRK